MVCGCICESRGRVGCVMGDKYTGLCETSERKMAKRQSCGGYGGCDESDKERERSKFREGGESGLREMGVWLRVESRRTEKR